MIIAWIIYGILGVFFWQGDWWVSVVAAFLTVYLLDPLRLLLRKIVKARAISRRDATTLRRPNRR